MVVLALGASIASGGGGAACSSTSDPTIAADAAVTSDASPFDAATRNADAKAADAENAPDAAACTLSQPYSTKDAVCNECAQSHCCQAVNDCYADDQCNDTFVNCILGCALTDSGGTDGTNACIAQCGVDSPQGKAEYAAISDCLAASCATECK